MINIINMTIVTFLILGIAALSGYFSEKVGIINLCIEGFMIAGALGYSLSGYIFTHKMNMGNAAQFLSIIVGILFGMLAVLLHDLITNKLNGNHVVSGIAINMLMAGLAVIFGSLKLGGRTGSIISGYEIIKFTNTSPVSIWIIPILLLMGGLWFLSMKTKWGTRMRACGENPDAVASLGVNVNRVRLQSLLISGALGGLAGGLFVAARTSHTFSGSVNGWGFIALGLLIFGQWKILPIILSTIFFSVLISVTANIPVLTTSMKSIPPSTWQIIPYILSLIALVFMSYKSRAPKWNGKPYIKSV